MGQCACHPDIETRFLFMKHNPYLYEECLKCQDSEIYCKFRSLKDLDTLRGFAAAGQKAVIVGGGYIGIEVAVVLRQMGLEVDVVEVLPQILMATTEPEFIIDVEKTLDAGGVGLVTNRKVAEFRSRNGRGVDVKLENGETLPADFAVLSVGVVPNVELAAGADIQTSAIEVLKHQIAQLWTTTNQDQ